MNGAGIGRLLVASLHQGIADVLPTRLEFYESWLNPAGLRNGRIGLAPMAAVVSFLRLEGETYRLVAERAGEYTAEWSAAEIGSVYRRVVMAMPPAIRARLVMRLAGGVIHSTYSGSRIVVRWRHGQAEAEIRGSVFCAGRERAAEPLCIFYAAAIGRLMHLFQLDAEVRMQKCRGFRTNDQCTMSVVVGPAGVRG
jgi:hypothetical protein